MISRFFKLSIFYVILFSITYLPLKGQERTDAFKVTRKGLLNRIELIFGSNYLATRGAVSFSENIILHKTPKLGYSTGLSVTHIFSKKLELDARFLWERKHYHINEDWYSLYDSLGQLDVKYLGTNSFDVTNDYLTISITPQYLLSEHFSVGAGIYVGQLYKSRTQAQYHVTAPYSYVTYNSNLEYENYDYGLSFNVAYSRTYKEIKYTIRLSDSYGLKNIPTKWNEVTQPASSNYRIPWYNNTYSITIGISYSRFNDKINAKF